MDIRYRKANIEDADLLTEIYNASFYNDFLTYGECPGYSTTREEMEKSIGDYQKFMILLYRKIPVGELSY